MAALDAPSCFAEKFLANADRGTDASTMGRDIIDLAFMNAHWGEAPMRAGLVIASEAYGKVVTRDARRAATKMLEQAQWRRQCTDGLNVTDTRTLQKGLRDLVKHL